MTTNEVEVDEFVCDEKSIIKLVEVICQYVRYICTHEKMNDFESLSLSWGNKT